MSDKILSVKNLKVQFNGTTVLENVSFDVDRGTTLAIVGPNGAGKTVLFRSLIGSLSYQGEISWSKDARVAYVPQRLDLDPHLSLTLVDFLMAKINLLKLSPKVIKEVLELCHLEESQLNTRLNKLSTGQFQRALIGFALIGEPNIILLDEPTSGVDLPREEHVYHTLHELQDKKNIAIVLISHDLHLVYGHANKVICLNKQMICFGEPKDLSSEILKKVYGEHVPYEHKHDNS